MLTGAGKGIGWATGLLETGAGVGLLEIGAGVVVPMGGLFAGSRGRVDRFGLG